MLYTVCHMLHTINIYCVLYRELYGENCMEMTPNKHMSYFMILIMTFRCIYIYNCVRLHTTYMVCRRLHTRYNMLYSLCYILCIPYHIHYMQHTTHSFLCIISSKYQQYYKYISYIVYNILCTGY